MKEKVLSVLDKEIGTIYKQIGNIVSNPKSLSKLGKVKKAELLEAAIIRLTQTKKIYSIIEQIEK